MTIILIDIFLALSKAAMLDDIVILPVFHLSNANGGLIALFTSHHYAGTACIYAIAVNISPYIIDDDDRKIISMPIIQI